MLIKNSAGKSLIAVLSATALMLAGCNSPNIIPKNAEKEFAKSLETKKLIDSWKATEPSLTYINDGGTFSITEPMKIPPEIANKPFKSHLSSSNKMADLAGLLAPMGIFVSIPDESIRNKPLVVFEFDGKLGDFLMALGAAYEVSFNFNPGSILTVEKSSMYMVKIPQDQSVADSIVGNIKNLGAQDVDVSMAAGAVSYKADYRTHQRVTNFLEYVSANAALVSMQVAIITVALDKSRKTGIDWSELNFHVGQAAAFQNAQTVAKKFADSNKTGSTGSNGNTNTGSGSDSENSGASDVITGSLLKGVGMADFGSDSQVGGQGSHLQISKGDFAISAVIDYLSTYGKTETTQSLLMKTLSGKEVAMKSAKEVAYVDSVGVSNLTGNGGSNGNGSSNSNNSNNNSNNNNSNGNGGNSNLGFGTVKIETVDVGLDLKLSPHYQAHSELVTIGVGLKLSSLLSFVNLSAGNQLGSITRPNTQQQEFTDIVKIKAGETVVIGGITYDQKGDNRNAPTIFENVGAAHRDSTFSRNAMIIMIRPTVTVFKKLEDADQKIVRE